MMTATTTLSNEEMAMLAAFRHQKELGNATVAVDPVVIETTVVNPFVKRMMGLNGTSLNRSRGVMPGATINTKVGRRGVFWVGMKNGTLRVGTCKLTETGRCHKPNKFDGCWFESAENLAQYNAS